MTTCLSRFKKFLDFRLYILLVGGTGSKNLAVRSGQQVKRNGTDTELFDQRTVPRLKVTIARPRYTVHTFYSLTSRVIYIQRDTDGLYFTLVPFQHPSDTKRFGSAPAFPRSPKMNQKRLPPVIGSLYLPAIFQRKTKIG